MRSPFPPSPVEAQLQARREAFMFSPSGRSSQPLPVLSHEELDALSKAYPPRCIREGEGLEEHLRYAGKVDLVVALRAALEESLEDRLDAPPLDNNTMLEAYVERHGQEID